MKHRKYTYALIATYILVLIALTYIFQMYILTALEEIYIFLYDGDAVCGTLASPGGAAQLLASLCSQFFICRYAGPLFIGMAYAIIILPLCGMITKRSPVYVTALAPLPCLCLMLCLENSAFELRGITAMALITVTLWAYSIIGKAVRTATRTTIGIGLSILLYWMAGSAAIAMSLCFTLYDLLLRPGTSKEKTLSLTYPVVCLATAYMYYLTEHVSTISRAFTPEMYYDLGSTYFMMLYAQISLPLIILAIAMTKTDGDKPKPSAQALIALLIFAAECGISAKIYSAVHSVSNYENNQQRFYARHDMWDAILAMPYRGDMTPYTDYRFLAMAKKGILADNISQYRPFISYLLENKPKVKKRDQQVYSDIWYQCHYMPAARHSAFDTDIVTSGAFNPFETQKLALINIAYGDYAVADKLLTMLEKTLYYSGWAKEQRKYLYNDPVVEADPLLGYMRKAIPVDNFYLSPKGIQRDLKYIIDNNPNQLTAKEFYKAFLILTHQSDPTDI